MGTRPEGAASSFEQPVEVEAYAGSRYPERPLRVRWRGKMREVGEIERQWQEPEGRYFVLTLESAPAEQRDDIRLCVCYHLRNDAWTAEDLGGH